MKVQRLIAQSFSLLLTIMGSQVALGDQQGSGKIIASIKPLGLITEAIVEGSTIEVEVLLPPTSSPHNYALKISDARQLQTADLVIWLGGDPEPYINPGKTKSDLALLNYLNKDLLILEHEQGHSDHHHSVDPHIWLDPRLAVVVVGLIAERLIGLYPEQKSLIEKNVHSFNDKNAEIDRELKRSLQPYQSTGFLAYHNAYGYFVRHYGLHQLGVIQQQGGRTLSVKHLLELQALIEPGEAVCVFREPQFIKAPLPDLGGGRELKNGILDPLGIEAQSYQQLLKSLTNQFVKCFNEDGSESRR